MSQNPSPKQSSNGSAAQFIKVVEQLIDSDEEQKNLKKLTTLKAEFPVLKKMHPFMSNHDKLQTFLHDPHFKIRAAEKLMEKGIYMPGGFPILKVYLVSTRYGASVIEEFDEGDLLTLFQRFGILTNFYVSNRFAFLTYQQIISAYLAAKTMNQFPASQYVRLCVKLCSEDEGVEAQSLFLCNNIRNTSIHENPSACQQQIQNQKYIVKFIFQAEILPQFNIAQRIIGPRGNYLKSIIDKVLAQQSKEFRNKFTNVESWIKIRLRGKGSGFHENHKREAEEKMHLFVSTISKDIQEQTCVELEKLLLKVFQDYKVHYQKLFRQHVYGMAYKVFQCDGPTFIQIQRVLFEDIVAKVDILSSENEGRLSQREIEDKLKERERMRKSGRFQEADNIRDWLKSRGVRISDSKIRGKTCAWSYQLQ